MSYCTSCGSDIPEGQGRSCSMCYGDIAYGKDGYYQQWAEDQIQLQLEKQQAEEEYNQMMESKIFQPTPGATCGHCDDIGGDWGE